MNELNPYQASAASGQLDSGTHAGGVSALVVSHLSRTKPWVQLIGILGIIFGVLMGLVSLGALLGGSAFANAARMTPGAPPLPGGVFVGIGVLYLFFSVLYLLISIKLFSYGSAIAALRYSGSVQHLELAMDRQRSFWKMIGIMTLIGIVAGIVGFVGMMAFSMTVASKMQSEVDRRWKMEVPAKSSDAAEDTNSESK